MIRIVTSYLRIVLTIVLAVGMILSSNSRMAAHDVTELTQIVIGHSAEIEEHGHAHEDIVIVMDAYHGHAHDVVDHDHNVALMPSRPSSGIELPTRTIWALANAAMPDRKDSSLDRPPRL
jgi:hypothetical protein